MGTIEGQAGSVPTRRSEVTVCRLAALAGITGAILTQAALLVGAYLVLVNGMSGRALAAVLGTAAIGGMLMLGTRRVAVRTSRRDALAAAATMRLVSDSDGLSGHDPHKSAA